MDTETGKPIGDGNPALKDPGSGTRWATPSTSTQIVEKVYQGAGQPGDTIIPPAYTSYRWQPPADQAFTYDLDKAGQLLDAAGYKKGVRRAAHDAGRRARSARSGSSARSTRRRR